MIKNEAQLKVAQAQRTEALRSARSTEHPLDRPLNDFAEDIQQEIDDYIGVRDGYITQFPITSLDDVATALIKARLARGWTQKDLAERLGVAEQMVQRDEAKGYERASLARLADVADVLGYELRGVLRPQESDVKRRSRLDLIEEVHEFKRALDQSIRTDNREIARDLLHKWRQMAGWLSQHLEQPNKYEYDVVRGLNRSARFADDAITLITSGMSVRYAASKVRSVIGDVSAEIGDMQLRSVNTAIDSNREIAEEAGAR
jgi:transcriptional regulator with XRE-family HTH domain